MDKATGRAEIYLNEKFLQIVTLSLGGVDYAEPSAPPHYLPPDCDDATLGATLRVALAGSKRISGREFVQLFHSGVLQKLGEERVNFAMQEYGYKTKRAMYKNMNNCSISFVDGKVDIQPTHHDSIDGYSATKGGPKPLAVDASCSDAELGTALRVGFERCTSSV